VGAGQVSSSPAPAAPKPLQAIEQFVSNFAQGAAREFTHLTGIGAKKTDGPAAQGMSVLELSRTQKKAFDPETVPQMSQTRPIGADASYTNGASNCGPTSMAMLARAVGYGADLNDAQLISKFAQVGKSDGEGTSANGMVAIAGEMGMQASVKCPTSADDVAAQLKAGKAVVVCGNYDTEPQHYHPEKGPRGHYLLITGQDKQGNFILRDPFNEFAKPPPALTPTQLQEFLSTANGGGTAIALGAAPKPGMQLQVKG
jgi:hypothetical protein